MSTAPNHPHIVIGGGISGLGAAHFARRHGTDSLVLERSDRAGGTMHSVGFDGIDDFWVESGTHSCFNSYGNLLAILEELGELDRIIPKPKLHFDLWRNAKRSSLFSAVHPLNLALSLPKLFLANKSTLGVRDYYGRGLGMKNYRDLFAPAFRAVICQPPDDYPATALFRKKPRRKEIARSFTMPDGLGAIPAAIAAQPGIELRTAAAVSAIERTNDDFVVRLSDGSELGCAALTLATPPDVTAALLPDSLAELRGLIDEIGVAEIETLVLVARADDLLHIGPTAGLISADDAFFSAVSRDFVADQRYRGFAFHFPAGELEPDAQLACACRALNITPDQIVAERRVTNRLPALRTGHNERVERIDALLRTSAGGKLAVTGNWFLGVSVEDCLVRCHAEDQRLFGNRSN